MATLPLPPTPSLVQNPRLGPKTKIRDRVSLDHPTLSLLQKCPDPAHLKQIHAHMLRLGLFFHPFSATRLLAAAAVPPSGDLHYATRLFGQIPHPNLYCFNTLIRAYASGPAPQRSFSLFVELLYQSDVEAPNKFTFPFLIKAASELSDLSLGKAVHGIVSKLGLAGDVFILNSLIHFYASCLCLDHAYHVFERIPQRDVVSWNSIITAFAQADHPDEALDLFHRMDEENIWQPNEVTMVSVLSACAKKGDIALGERMGDYIQNSGIKPSLVLSNAMLDMYTKCGNMEYAQKVFREMEKKDSISCTTMIVGYAKAGDFDAAFQMFEAMDSRDIASWNALISTYEQSGRPKEALDLFRRLQLTDTRPDEVTLVSTLSACAQLGTIELGRWIHAYVKKHNFRLNLHLTTSLIDMYAKCGDLERAFAVFSSVEKKDVYVWSAMIAGLAMHGQGRAAVDLFLQMQAAKVKPNGVTFTNVLCACSHAGLVDSGMFFFNQMSPLYGVIPKIEHYGCMVDILGRAGLLDEAVDLIKNMPMPPHASVWGALLGACRIHGNRELGELASKRILELDPGNDGAYVLLSNIYAKLGKWDDVAKLRKLMKDAGIKKEPGCSLVEVDGVVHEFLVGDSYHPSSAKIYSKLDEIASRLKYAGYVPNTTQLLQNVEAEDMKEQALHLHSEKLAISFGLISTKPPAPIRIVKNLRICDDCHSAAKFISSVYDREIILRDRYRFHHFKEGHCSCRDFW